MQLRKSLFEGLCNALICANNLHVYPIMSPNIVDQSMSKLPRNCCNFRYSMHAMHALYALPCRRSTTLNLYAELVFAKGDLFTSPKGPLTFLDEVRQT